MCFPSCPCCKKNDHQHNKCWLRLDAKSQHKRSQLGHYKKYADPNITLVKIIKDGS